MKREGREWKDFKIKKQDENWLNLFDVKWRKILKKKNKRREEGGEEE